jgi:hypothetical protein
VIDQGQGNLAAIPGLHCRLPLYNVAEERLRLATRT